MALLQIAEPGQSPLPHETRHAIGIDLGTTNSLVASVRQGMSHVMNDAEGRALAEKYLRHWMNLHLKISVNMHFWFLPDSERGHTGFMRRLAIQTMYAGFENIIRKL